MTSHHAPSFLFFFEMGSGAGVGLCFRFLPEVVEVAGVVGAEVS